MVNKNKNEEIPEIRKNGAASKGKIMFLIMRMMMHGRTTKNGIMPRLISIQTVKIKVLNRKRVKTSNKIWDVENEKYCREYNCVKEKVKYIAVPISDIG
jgi:hypothetical protein